MRRQDGTWKPCERSGIHVVCLGAKSKWLTLNYQVYDGATKVKVQSFNPDVVYVIPVDAVNESGVEPGP